MTLPAALTDYLERAPDAAVVFAADGSELWRNDRVTPAILEAIAVGKRQLSPPESAVTVGSLSIAVVDLDGVRVVTVRDVPGLGRDPLTGLHDRTVFAAHLEQATAAARRGRSGALLYFDIDGLKAVNDTRGHQEGDRYLVTFAESLVNAVRAEDVVARLGGDEFGVLMRFATAEHLGRLAVAVHGRLCAPACVGVALIDGTVDAAGLLARADAACYAAKAKGRNTVEVAP